MQRERTRERNPAFERYLIDLAVESTGLPDDGGIRAFSDARTMPGPIRLRDFKQDAGEEIADLINYATWRAEEHYEGYLAGDAYHAAEFARYLDITALGIQAWRRLLSG